MTTCTVDNAQRTAAKIAGVAGLVAFGLVVFGNYVLLDPLIVPRNAADTARNILAHQTQFRVALTCFIAYGIGSVVLLSALYTILAPVNRSLAFTGALFRLVFAILWLIAPLNSLAALRLLGDATYLKVFEPDRLQALARVQLAGRFDDYYVGLPFFGLIASAWCVLCAFIFLIFPNFNKIVNDYIFDSPMAMFELIVSIWLLFKGIRTPNPGEADLVAERSRKSVSLRLPAFL